MTVRVSVSMSLADMAEFRKPERLGEIVAELREMDGVTVDIEAPSPDQLDIELDHLQALLSAALDRFKSSNAEINKLQARIDSARGVNKWLHRVEGKPQTYDTPETVGDKARAARSVIDRLGEPG